MWAAVASGWKVLRQVSVLERDVPFGDAMAHELALDDEWQIKFYLVILDVCRPGAETIPDIVVQLLVVRAVSWMGARVSEVFGSDRPMNPRTYLSGIESVGLEGLLLERFDKRIDNACEGSTHFSVRAPDTDFVDKTIPSRVSGSHQLAVGKRQFWTATTTEGESIADVAQDGSVGRPTLVAQHFDMAAQTIEDHTSPEVLGFVDLAVELDRCWRVHMLCACGEEDFEKAVREVGLLPKAFFAIKTSKRPVSGDKLDGEVHSRAVALEDHARQRFDDGIHQYLPE